MSDQPFDPSTRYVAVCASGLGKELEVSPRFWSDLGQGKIPELNDGWLVAAFPVRKDWTEWEMHPEGEEILTLLSGDIEMSLDSGGPPRTISLRVGQSFVMPRGTWHHVRVKQPGLMLGITYGRGTQHRPFTPG